MGGEEARFLVSDNARRFFYPSDRLGAWPVLSRALADAPDLVEREP